MKEFLFNYVQENQAKWKVQSQIINGKGLQYCLLLVFGEPRTVIFAHMDFIEFIVRLGKQLIRIGGPNSETSYKLVGEDSHRRIEYILMVDEEEWELRYEFEIKQVTELVFKPDFRKRRKQCRYLDTRLGVWNVLQVAETLEDGTIAFGCWEKTGGGSVGYLVKYTHRTYGVTQALISDITWFTEGVLAGTRWRAPCTIPSSLRRSFVQKIIKLAQECNIAFQVEVERAGGSVSKELHYGNIPQDWCFIGAPEDNVHSPGEIVHKKDIYAMVDLYKLLMYNL